MRLGSAWMALASLLLCAFPTRAQEHVTTLAETFTWIGAQEFQVAATHPDFGRLLLDETGYEGDSGCYGSLHEAVAHMHSGCAPHTFGAGVIDDGCRIQFVHQQLRANAPVDCTHDAVLWVEADIPYDMVYWTEDIAHDGMVCTHAEYRSHEYTAHVRTEVRFHPADISGASATGTDGHLDERFWILSRNGRDTLHVSSSVRDGNQHAVDAHDVMFYANSRQMAERLTHAFQHVADLCAPAAGPPEPF